MISNDQLTLTETHDTTTSNINETFQEFIAETNETCAWRISISKHALWDEWCFFYFRWPINLILILIILLLLFFYASY